MIVRKTYPVYRLWVTSLEGVRRYHTARKKAFLMRLDGLSRIKTRFKMRFVVEYLPGIKNESVVYGKHQLRQAQKDARTFTTPNEIRFVQGYWKNAR